MRVLRPSGVAGRRIDRKSFRCSIFCALISTGLIIGCGRHRIVANPPALAPNPEANPPTGPLPPATGQPPAIRPPSSQSPATTQFREQGIASWYGVPFNGRRTSDGETYDMFQYTAAHRTLPFGAIVRVTNLSNGKQTLVRVNDRGPFVANRIIDLSYAAAVALGMIGTGTAPVRIESVGGPNPDIGLFGVQVGAFQVEENAVRLREKLATQYSPVTIATVELSSGALYRVRVGRMANEEMAHELANRLQREEQLTTFVVRLDD